MLVGSFPAICCLPGVDNREQTLAAGWGVVLCFGTALSGRVCCRRDREIPLFCFCTLGCFKWLSVLQTGQRDSTVLFSYFGMLQWPSVLQTGQRDSTVLFLYFGMLQVAECVADGAADR